MKFLSVALLCAVLTLSAPAHALWVSGYYPGWESARLPPSKVRFDALTHLFQFGATVHLDGALTLSEYGLTPDLIAQSVAAAHAAHRKILLVVGGAQSGARFALASAPPQRAQLVAGIAQMVARYNYDGADVDWEPIMEADNANYRAFIVELRAALRRDNAEALLTAATTLDKGNNPQLPQMFADLQGNFDQINLMTYDMAGPWPGWVSWHNAPLFSGGQKLPGGSELPSMEGYVAAFVEAGVAREKLGVGLAFYGTHWSGGSGTSSGGVTAPLQNWTQAPQMSQVAYAEIMANYYARARVHYDRAAQTPYLSFDEPGATDDSFVSYTDARAVTARLDWARQQRLGGCIIWQIAQDAMPDGAQPLTGAVAAWMRANS